MPYWAVAPFGDCTDATAYGLLNVDPKDTEFQATIVGYKQRNPKLRVVASIGGWNYPSAYFSTMAATAAGRGAFAASVKQYLSANRLDGVDIDWEYPCSAPRTNSVKITDSKFRYVKDAGGNCPRDTHTFPLLLQALREALGPDALITVASQAAPMVRVTPGISLAPMVGLMQMKPMGLPASRVSRTMRATSASTSMSVPTKAKLHRFLAAPKPPGKTRASNWSACTSARSVILPRAIRADSTSTLRVSGISSPVMWLSTWAWSLLGAVISTSAPARSRQTHVSAPR